MDLFMTGFAGIGIIALDQGIEGGIGFGLGGSHHHDKNKQDHQNNWKR
jgi:hypothetical protein